MDHNTRHRNLNRWTFVAAAYAARAKWLIALVVILAGIFWLGRSGALS